MTAHVAPTAVSEDLTHEAAAVGSGSFSDSGPASLACVASASESGSFSGSSDGLLSSPGAKTQQS